MALVERDIFSFTWQIAHFSMSPELPGFYMDSPIFVVGNIKWRCYMYPRGEEDMNYIACYLEKIESDKKNETIVVGLEFIAYSVHAKKNIHLKLEEYTFADGESSSWGSSEFCLRKDILNNVNGFLPNDTLTIGCRIWRRIDAEGNIPKPSAPNFRNLLPPFNDPALQREMFSTAARDEFLKFQTHFSSNHYLARTCIRVERKCINWPIRRFSALRPNQRLSIPIVSTAADIPSLVLTFYLSGQSFDDQSFQIEIRIEESDVIELCFVRCQITAINGSMKCKHIAKDEHFFELNKKNDVWEFPTFLQMTSLMKEKCLDATQGTLNLECKFALSIARDPIHISGADSVPLLNRFPKSVKEELNDAQSISKRLYEEGNFSDVTLQTGDQMYKAHKSILSTRSPVFRAMFETNMKEKESGVVDIADYDPDTVKQLLTFIYTNSLEDLESDRAMKLYSIADKYEVPSLKWQCSNLLKSTLATSNVCKVLTFADLYQDGDLLDHVQNYIHLNSNVILNSQMWKELMKANLALASRVMFDLLTGKMGIDCDV